ncbi:MAG: TonB-dependent receptor [Opitutaceae bacterium]|nr:TonB-dependent receptor [Opitutaceae bacterium]
MKSLFPFVSVLLALSASARAQTAAPVESAPAGETTHLEKYVVTASPLARAQDEINAPTTVVAGAELAQRLQPTLGETLSGLPGVDSTYFGPGASRPIIRGLGGDRIRVLTGGVGTIDASVISPDHAVSLDPLLIDRVEIVRGPASLLYGGGAIGGVVNIIDGRIPETLPVAPVTGRFEVRGNSGADERAAAGVVTGAAGKLAWRLDGFRRKTDDVRIPGLGPTPAIAAEMIANGETPSDGILINSATETSGGAAGLSYIGESGHLGAAFSGFDSLYGTVAEQEVTIKLRQRRFDAHGEWLKPIGILRAAKFNFGLADYQHDELEGTTLGTRFKNKGYEGRFELLHEKLGVFEGALGFQSTRSDFEAIGEEAFLPPTVTKANALFLYEEVVSGPVTWQFGARAERQTITPEAGSGFTDRSHSLATFTGGAVWKLNADYAIALSLSSNQRAPNAQELFADGPHIGTGTFEFGDPTLGKEKSVGFDLSLRKRRGFVTGELSVFVNKFNGYIFEQDTGDEEDDLPVFAYVQRDAKLYGGEAEVTFHLHESKSFIADLRLFADSVRATNTTDGTPLPRTTPVRFGAAFDWQRGPWAFNAELRHVESQRRIAPVETATAGYELLSLGGSWRFALGQTKGEVFIQATNLLDETARVHASFLKDIAPLPGRNVSVGLRLNF